MNPLPIFLKLPARISALQRPRTAAIAIVALLLAAAAGLYAVFQSTPQAPPQLASMLPQGALLTIESRDFAGLLQHWNDSPQKAAWLKSDNYGSFSRSRLFGRLGEAQKEYAEAAGFPQENLGTNFLSTVAGSDSVFAWYDIGKLEFLYITRLPPGRAEQNPLMQLRSKFTTRRVGDQSFYVRTQADSKDGAESTGEPRVVAFATHGDWLVLATREDLIAGALTLMSANAAASGSAEPANPSSLAPLSREPWYMDAIAPAPKLPGALRMTLNLAKIVPSPYFRSYWIQENVSEMKRYRSAVSDLYTETGDFREERILLPKSPTSDDAPTPDLSALTALLPSHYGVYRAIALPTPDSAVAGIREKLLQRSPESAPNRNYAPDPDLTIPSPGTATDLETRIDIPPPALPASGIELEPLQQALANSGLNAIMTVSRTHEPVDGVGGIWVPFQSAIVLSATSDWNLPQMQSALQQALQAHLTASGMGVDWHPVESKTGIYYQIGDARPLAIAARGKLCLLANDSGLLLEMLSNLPASVPSRERNRKPTRKPQETPPIASPQPPPTLIAGFDLSQERASFARWTALVDKGTLTLTNRTLGQPTVPDTTTEIPAFFSQNMRSLGDAFAALQSEQFVEHKDGKATRQTVTYAWQP